MKDPVCIFECRRGFSLWRARPVTGCDREPCDRAGLIIRLRTALVEFSSGERCVMPVWLDILINVMGYAGFIAVATYHRSPSNKLPDR